MVEPTVTVTQISDLLRRRRPLSGGTLHSSTAHSSSSAKPPNPNSHSTTPKILTSLSQPSVLVGTLSLPSNTTSCRNCFSFSDSSGNSVCSDVLNFDFRMIDNNIRVLNWNFVPTKSCNGLLEIINWEFVEPCSSLAVKSSLVLNLVGLCGEGASEDDSSSCSKARHSVCGVLGSVSPLSVVSSDGDGMNSRCFIAEVLSCDCGFCKEGFGCNAEVLSCDRGLCKEGLGCNAEVLSCDCGFCKQGKDCKKVGTRMDGRKEHCFKETNFVYFDGETSRWHSAMVKLVGEVVVLKGLRKKRVYLGKEEVRLMFVTTTGTRLSCRKLGNRDLWRGCGKSSLEVNGGLGMYVGVVRDVYMQGMIVELDQEVWLLLTDQLCVVPHSLRVGAVLFLRNVHILNPKFPWRKILILGACHKTSINVVSFSPFETGCQLPPQSLSHLGRFIGSLAFPAGLWVLLLVRCFRNKFSRTFSEKEILGSKHREGLVEAYARSILPVTVFRSQLSMFMEFCKHDLCGTGPNVSFDSLNLAVPFSNFVSNCDRIWVKSLINMKSGLRILEDCAQVNHFPGENRVLDQPIRRIVPSKDIGVSLLGNLKICPATGKLQFIDATGSIDVVVPDFPSVWNIDAVYEVMEYSLVLEGKPEMRGQTWMLEDDLFSCRSIFRSVRLERQMELVVYVHFAWTNVICRDLPICQNLSCSARLEPGIFHLLHLVHKFPVQPQSGDDLIIPGKCFSFAEATVLPWDLSIATSDDGVALPVSIQQDLEKRCRGDLAFKRCKTNHLSVCSKKFGLGSNCNHGDPSCSHSSNLITLPHKSNAPDVSAFPVQISCAVAVRRLHGERMTLSGILFSQADGNNDTINLESPKKVLLEYDSENLFKHKFLHIGGYYVMKHSAEKCFCDSMDESSVYKAVVNLDTDLWRLSFYFDGTLLHTGLYDQSLDSCSISGSSCLQNELLFHPCSAVGRGISSDVNLHFTSDAMSLQALDHQALKEAIIKLSRRLIDVCGSFHSVGRRNSLVNVIQDQGTLCWNNLPQGDLVSLLGTVVSLHFGSCAADKFTRHSSANGVHQPKLYQGVKNLIWLHVLTHGHMVEISGCLYDRNRPIGLGPGADVTFHRVLALGEQDRLLLMPVSFITINSVKEVLSPVPHSFCLAAKENALSCSIPDLAHCDECKPRRFRCRIVAVQIVVLERNTSLDKMLLNIQSRKAITNIPLAGFILDDGSLQCCCWASGERAATFLRLHEQLPQVGFGGCWWRFPDKGSDKASSTAIAYLGKILKRHGRLTLKNYGSLYENSTLDIQLSVGSEFMFDSEDESILRFILLNACSGPYWNVTAHEIDSNAMNELGKCLTEEQMNLLALPNFWATDVFPVDVLAEARSLYQALG